MSKKPVKHKGQTGGLQEKQVKIPPTKEEIKEDVKQEKAKRKAKRKERKKDRVGFFGKIKEVFGELKKVRWPSFGQTAKGTGVVLAVVLIFSLVVFGIDQGLFALYRLLTRGLV